MTEHAAEHPHEHAEQPDLPGRPDEPGRPAPEPTGNEAVDAVLESLVGLEDRPAGEHVAVFESAHDRLRAVLSDAGNDTPNDSGG